MKERTTNLQDSTKASSESQSNTRAQKTATQKQSQRAQPDNFALSGTKLDSSLDVSIASVIASNKPSPQSNIFRKKMFPLATLAEWNNWEWQLQNRICTYRGLSNLLELSNAEKNAFSENTTTLPFSITPYYAALLDPLDPLQSLRRIVVPTENEQFNSPGEADDPLNQAHFRPHPCIVHRYPDRVLFLVTSQCATYCRYCTNSRFPVKKENEKSLFSQWESAIEYIKANNSIRDVLISGGDPLTLHNDKLEWLLSRLRSIVHVEMIRLGTNIPAVLPQRINLPLVKMLKRFHPLYISIQVTHPHELTPEMNRACIKLADAGIPLGSQTVLLSGINDDAETIRTLTHGLLRVRVKPYYLYQCDPLTGSSHFRTPISKGLDITRSLRGFTSGYAVPTFVIDAPGGGGKIPLSTDYTVGREGGDLVVRNFRGDRYRYPDYSQSSTIRYKQMDLFS